MSEKENERDFIKVCFNVVAGLEVKNESQAIAKEAILDEVEYLTKENNQLKEVIEEVREKCKEPRKEMDYTVWLKLRHYIDTLEEFEKDIESCLHPIVTSAYKSDIKNAIKELCEIIKYKLVFKEDIKDILDKAKENKQCQD